MKCTVCGARMNAMSTDLPFKLSDDRIVILKQLPVLQCEACCEYLIEDAVWHVSTSYSPEATALLSLK